MSAGPRPTYAVQSKLHTLNKMKGDGILEPAVYVSTKIPGSRGWRASVHELEADPVKIQGVSGIGHVDDRIHASSVQRQLGDVGLGPARLLSSGGREMISRLGGESLAECGRSWDGLSKQLMTGRAVIADGQAHSGVDSMLNAGGHGWWAWWAWWPAVEAAF